MDSPSNLLTYVSQYLTRRCCCGDARYSLLDRVGVLKKLLSKKLVGKIRGRTRQTHFVHGGFIHRPVGRVDYKPAALLKDRVCSGGTCDPADAQLDDAQ